MIVFPDRIIVQNYFGHFSGLGAVVGSKNRCGWVYYDKIFRLCMALTNVFVRYHPFQSDDFYNNNFTKIGSTLEARTS